MPKPEFGVCRHEEGGVPEVIEAYAERDKCMAALIRKRASVPEADKWRYLMLPLDNKGRGLLPPGVR